MPNIFLISDTHFGQESMYSMVDWNGRRVREEFSCMEEAEEVMVERWNAVVKPTDKVYHLGDVFIARKGRFILERLNGDKVLIKGNHDIFKLKEYTPYFRDIRAYHRMENIVFSHIPQHPDTLSPKSRRGTKIRGNVHGHLHRHVVKDNMGFMDHRYVSVCVERTDYTPVEFSVIQKALPS